MFSSAAPRQLVLIVKPPETTIEVDGVDTVLSWIKAEHIAEMRYANCWDRRLRSGRTMLCTSC